MGSPMFTSHELCQAGACSGTGSSQAPCRKNPGKKRPWWGRHEEGRFSEKLFKLGRRSRCKVIIKIITMLFMYAYMCCCVSAAYKHVLCSPLFGEDAHFDKDFSNCDSTAIEHVRCQQNLVFFDEFEVFHLFGLASCK